MGRHQTRWIYNLDLSIQKYRCVRIFNAAGTSFNVMVMTFSDAHALLLAERKEPGYEYEIVPGFTCHRLFIGDQFVTK